MKDSIVFRATACARVGVVKPAFSLHNKIQTVTYLESSATHTCALINTVLGSSNEELSTGSIKSNNRDTRLKLDPYLIVR